MGFYTTVQISCMPKAWEYIAPVLNKYGYEKIGEHVNKMFKVRRNRNITVVETEWIKFQNRPIQHALYDIFETLNLYARAELAGVEYKMVLINEDNTIDTETNCYNGVFDKVYPIVLFHNEFWDDGKELNE